MGTRRDLRPIVQAIADVAEEYPSRIALRSGDVSRSYRELTALANGIIELLVDAGVTKASRIGIVTSDSDLTYAAILAIVASGNAYVPINADNPVSRTRKVIRQAGIDFVLADSAQPGTAGGKLANLSVTVIETTSARPVPGRLEVAEMNLDALAYLFFTSGSTGDPKGVPIQHRQLAAFMDSVLHDCDYGFNAEDRFLQMFSLTFDLSVMCIFAPWCVGATCCVVPASGLGALNVLDVLERERITVALMVPSVLSYIGRFLPELTLPDLRLSLFCGEALAHDLVTDWSRSVPNATIENVYGPTEATIFCSRYVWSEAASARQSFNGVVPIGTAMPNVATCIVDDGKIIKKANVRGELCLSGPQVMEGYWDNQDVTAAAFTTVAVDGREVTVYRTGDIVYEDAQSDLIYCGRADSQVKIDGHRIELGEIEHHARNHVGHALAAVTLQSADDGNPFMVLHVQDGDFSPESLRDHLGENLPAYMQPREIRIIERMPLNKSGKIDRRTLHDQA
jgi:amino acid adenylation domain-containing protein